ncbi:unnamed protein product [Closterium sp. NIES-65]|nr:unnamed protein product [Closterium sp. NIES-65]
MVGGAPAACPATQSGSGREEDGWREQKASSVSSELRPTSHQGGLQGGEGWGDLELRGFPPHLRSLTSLQDLPCSARLVPSPCVFPTLPSLSSSLDFITLRPLSPPPSLYPHQAFPIVGARYSCLDCPERAGFGLCAACYSCPPVLPRPGLPHSGGVLQLSCLPGVGGL